WMAAGFLHGGDKAVDQLPRQGIHLALAGPEFRLRQAGPTDLFGPVPGKLPANDLFPVSPVGAQAGHEFFQGTKLLLEDQRLDYIKRVGRGADPGHQRREHVIAGSAVIEIPPALDAAADHGGEQRRRTDSFLASIGLQHARELTVDAEPKMLLQYVIELIE